MIVICLFPYGGKEYALLDDKTLAVRAWTSLYDAEREWYNTWAWHEKAMFPERLNAYLFMQEFPVRFVEIDEALLTHFIPDKSVYTLEKSVGHMKGLEIEFGDYEPYSPT